MKLLYTSLLLAVLFFSKSLEAMYCFDGDPRYEDCPGQYIEDARLEFSGFTGKFISIDRAYGEFGVFKPLSVLEECCPFIDLKGYVFSNAKWAANGGLGCRGRVAYNSVIGFNAYYDYRRSDCKKSYNQVSLGFEWLNDYFDVQLNGYIPVGTRSNACFHSYNWGVESVYGGVDASIGAPLYSYLGFNLYALVGTYYLSQHQHSFFGSFGYVQLDWKTLISVQVRVSNDRIYSKNAQGMIQLSIPLDLFYCASPNECYSCRDLLSLPVRRIGMILLNSCSK